MNNHKNYKEVMQYVESVLDGSKPACEEEKQACERFKRDLEDDKYEFRPKDSEFVIQIIEKTFVHDQGEKLDGTPLRGEPFLLEPFQKFITYSILGFFHKGTKLRKYKEAFIFIPRKNGKTRFIAALSWALSLLERKSGSSLYIVAASLKQSLQSFKFIYFNLKQMGEAENFRILNNNHGHFIEGDLGDGSIHIEALAANPDRQDSLNSNIQILDELHAYRSAKQYNVIKESGKAYSNKLTIGITTAGDNMNSFCYKRLKYCQKILKQTVKDEAYFVFITKADENKDGEVDYTDPLQHEKANPNYRVTIRPEDIMNDAMQAQNDPQQRKDFLAKSLNIYTSATKAYFNVDEFRASDREYKWTLEELAKLPIDWYGGADLSKLHDLTAGALYGQYKDIDITVTHAFFPITAAYKKAEEDNIPLFGWKDDGWLTMTNSAVVNHQVIVNWFKEMKKKGFKIKQVGFDRKFGREFFLEMKRAGFKIEDTPQLYYLKSEGFRRIEAKAKDKKFYYLHSDAYEYCLENVKAVERTDDAVKYEKVMPTQRIDIFDASVFAAMQMLKNLNKAEATDKWLNLGIKKDKDKKGGD
jgi:phage terminase large subunit-like protein